MKMQHLSLSQPTAKLTHIDDDQEQGEEEEEEEAEGEGEGEKEEKEDNQRLPRPWLPLKDLLNVSKQRLLTFHWQ